jgi:acyl-coenzyme A synthetase/AMP-(fatty) acid ligase/acyl carrier protein
VPDEDTRLIPEQLCRWIVAEAISVAFLPTTLAERMLTIAWPTQTAFRLLLTGGEQLRRYSDPSLPFTLVNNYGPTENTVVATSGVVPPQEAHTPGQLPSIGRPIYNTWMYLLDRDLRPVPPGESGEMYIGGAGLGRCYLNNPAQTADRFLPDPFVQQIGARMYQTGDIGAREPGGDIQFLGRVDSQVKIRGFRVELGEIEAALQADLAVRECAVALRQKDGGEGQLIAYLVPQEGWTLQHDVLRTTLKETLPDYMIPAHFAELERLPLNYNGKVDRQALLALDVTEHIRERVYREPRTERERELANIWMELLSLEQVSIDDNFFELGGHSLSAVQLIFRVRKTFGVDMTLRTLFETSTIERIAQLIDSIDPEVSLRE